MMALLFFGSIGVKAAGRRTLQVGGQASGCLHMELLVSFRSAIHKTPLFPVAVYNPSFPALRKYTRFTRNLALHFKKDVVQ